MGTLRPIDPNNHDRTKSYDEYSKEEKVHAVTQIEDDGKNLRVAGKHLDDGTAELANKLAKGTDKEGNVDIIRASGASTSQQPPAGMSGSTGAKR